MGQQRALQVLSSALPYWKELYQQDLTGNKMFPNNFMAFSTQPFTKLPHDDSWIWNQSNAKITTALDQQHEVTLQKMNTRKRKNCPRAPSYKIWLFSVNKRNQPSHLYFLWCEKGSPAKPQQLFNCQPEKQQMQLNQKSQYNNMNMQNNLYHSSNNNVNNNNVNGYSDSNFTSILGLSGSGSGINPQAILGLSGGSFQPEQLTLDDLSFLKPFMDNDCEMELDW